MRQEPSDEKNERLFFSESRHLDFNLPENAEKTAPIYTEAVGSFRKLRR
jgi:hypothetical protein